MAGLFCTLFIFPSAASAQDTAPVDAQTTIRIDSRAVLVDVIVTDHKGNPVTGLKQDAFTVTENGKAQTVDFFEEHKATPADAAPVEIPKLPENTFSNYTPFPEPPVVTVLLLDSLNSRMESQSFVHKQALNFLKSAKPGERMAIFTMGLGLHFIQGFNDDPTVLLAALNNKKNNEVESSVMLKGQAETNAQANVLGMMSELAPTGPGVAPGPVANADAISALQNFFNETSFAQNIDRMHVTFTNLQKLAAFLEGFPGRKNIIWFAESVPSLFVSSSDTGSIAGATDSGVDKELKMTLAMLAAARAALYPVDARGLAIAGGGLYTAEGNLPKSITAGPQLLGAGGYFDSSLTADSRARNFDQASEQMMAEQSGGKAFSNSNGLAHIMKEIATSSGDFYSLSYKPTNAKMDGTYRTIAIKVANDKLQLSYRRGYFALDDALPGSSVATRTREIQQLAAKDPTAVDPLLPYMDLGMPQSQQIVYQAKISESSVGDKKTLYTIDFTVEPKYLDLPLDADGLHTGMLNISMLAYDRYGNIAGRKDHLVSLNIKPDVWRVLEQSGLQLHGQIEVPKGNYWLRTGIYDQNTRKVGTLEIPLTAVKPITASANHPPLGAGSSR